jgi:lipopolysaccharide biosynthesis protein
MEITVIDNKILMDTLLEIKQLLINKTAENDLKESFIESKKIPELLGISPKTWQTYRDDGIIPFIQVGAKIWVKRIDIEAFFEKNKKQL